MAAAETGKLALPAIHYALAVPADLSGSTGFPAATAVAGVGPDIRAIGSADALV